MWYDDFKEWFFGGMGKKPRNRPIKPPKKSVPLVVATAPAPSSTPAPKPASTKKVWLQIMEEVNEAIEKLEKNGADLHHYRVSLPPPAVAAMNDRIEEQLLRMGIPGRIHSTLAATLANYVFSQEISEKSAEAVMKAGIADDDTDLADLTQEQQNRLWEIESCISLQTFCRAIGVETDKKETEEVMKATKKWQEEES